MARSSGDRQAAVITLLMLAGTSSCARTPAATPVVAVSNPTVSPWTTDLAFLATELPLRHKNLYFKTTEAQFSGEVNTLRADIPHLSSAEIAIRMMRLVASVGDLHTQLAVNEDSLSRVPLRVYGLTDGWYVTGTTASYRSVLGLRLVQIGTRSIGDVEKALRPLSGCENDPCYRNQFPGLLQVADFLRVQGVLSSNAGGSFVFADSLGRRTTLNVAAIPPGTAPRTLTERLAIGSSSAEESLWLRNQNAFYWFEYVPASRTLYVAYNRCRESPTESMAAFAARLMATADANAVDRVVIDLRRNPGGNSGIFQPVIRALRDRPALNQRGKLFVVVGRGTFSSGFDNAMDLRRATQATFVGEPAGQKPNSYGEVKSMTLPNSGIAVTYSTRFWKRVDGDPMEFAPEILASPTFADFVNGRDPVMRAILQQPRQSSGPRE